jgi:predicted restriction endonuclease
MHYEATLIRPFINLAKKTNKKMALLYFVSMPHSTHAKRRAYAHHTHYHKHDDKVGRVMHEWKHGQLHSGSKHGPVVHSRRQAIAIALSEERQARAGRRR